MPILRKLKSLLGVGDGEDDAERDVTVTVEHDPENEAAVKGAEVEESTPSGDGDETTVADASEAEGAASETTTEASEDAVDEADGESDDEADETPDEVEIPDAEEPVEETADEEAVDEETDGTSAEETEADTEDADADDADEEDVDDSAAAVEPVDALNGIGSAYARRLGDAGIDTVADLADADAAELSEASDIAQGRIDGWIDQARDF